MQSLTSKICIAFGLLWSGVALASPAVTTTCSGPTEPAVGNAIVVTTTCVECGTSTAETISYAVCGSKGSIDVPCCLGNTWALCNVPQPPGTYCDNSDGGEKAKFSPGAKPTFECKGPLAPDPNGWTADDKSSYCNSNSINGFCCNPLATSSSKMYLSCYMPCPTGTICPTGGNACVPSSDPLVCTGQTEASPDGVYSVTLKSGSAVVASYSNTSNPSHCSPDSQMAGQFCCKHDSATNQDSIVMCTIICQKIVPGSCCVEGKCVSKSKCGDGVLNTGEQCDDGNTANGDGCDAKCGVENPAPFCGDNVINQPGEFCEPPNSAQCDDQCYPVSVCGNNIVQKGEQCDPPGTNFCDSQCQNIPACGDGVINQSSEQCDPPDGSKSCDSQCQKIPICGNGMLDPGEECDHGKLNDGSTSVSYMSGPPIVCSTNCKIVPKCGNKVIEGGEQCDPPNSATCSASCTTLPICGNKALDSGEQCDDGNVVSGDGCSSACQNEPKQPVPSCGDGIINQSSEQCEPANTATCSPTCTKLPVCGDGVVDPGEQCDDANIANGDGCSNVCRIEIPNDQPSCGNGTVELGEQCDDGNNGNGDGCSTLCQIEIPPIVPTGDFNTATVLKYGAGFFFPIPEEEPNKIPIILNFNLWKDILKVINLLKPSCSTTFAEDGNTWATTSTDLLSTVSYAPTCKDGSTLTGFVCIDNKLVTQTKTCPTGTACVDGKCVK